MVFENVVVKYIVNMIVAPEVPMSRNRIFRLRTTKKKKESLSRWGRVVRLSDKVGKKVRLPGTAAWHLSKEAQAFFLFLFFILLALYYTKLDADGRAIDARFWTGAGGLPGPVNEVKKKKKRRAGICSLKLGHHNCISNPRF